MPRADERDIVDADQRLQSLAEHFAAADADKSNIAGLRARSARISAAPSRSPDSSAAIRQTREPVRRLDRQRHASPKAVLPTTNRPARSAASATRERLRDDGLAGGHGNAGKPRPRGLLHGLRPERRQVEAPVLHRLRRLDQHAGAARESAAAPRRAAPRPDRACGRCLRRPRPPARGCPRPPPPGRRRTAPSRRSAQTRVRCRRSSRAVGLIEPSRPSRHQDLRRHLVGADQAETHDSSKIFATPDSSCRRRL